MVSVKKSEQSQVQRLDAERAAIQAGLQKARSAQDASEDADEIQSLGREVAGYEAALKVNERKRARAAAAESAAAKVAELTAIKSDAQQVAKDLAEIDALANQCKDAAIKAGVLRQQHDKLVAETRSRAWGVLRKAYSPNVRAAEGAAGVLSRVGQALPALVQVSVTDDRTAFDNPGRVITLAQANEKNHGAVLGTVERAVALAEEKLAEKPAAEVPQQVKSRFVQDHESEV